MINEIIEMFKNLTPILWVSQVCGFIGLIVLFVSYQFKKEKYLFISLIGLIILVVEQALALLITNLISTIIGCLRNLLMFYYLKKKNKELPLYDMIILLILMWSSGIIIMFTTNTLTFINFLPLVATTIQTTSQNSKNYFVLKAGLIIGLMGFIVYYYLSGMPISLFRESSLLVSAIYSTIVLIVKTIKDKNNKVSNNIAQ